MWNDCLIDNYAFHVFYFFKAAYFPVNAILVDYSFIDMANIQQVCSDKKKTGYCYYIRCDCFYESVFVLPTCKQMAARTSNNI